MKQFPNRRDIEFLRKEKRGDLKIPPISKENIKEYIEWNYFFTFIKKFENWGREFNILFDDWPNSKILRVNAFMTLRFSRMGMFLSSFFFFSRLLAFQRRVQVSYLFSLFFMFLYFISISFFPLE